MKKKAITLLLSLVLASGSMGNIQLLAAETTGQEAEAVQETETTAQEAESVQEGEMDDAAAAEDTAADVSDQETKEETIQENVEQFLENEDSEADETVDEEELDTSEEAAAAASETEDEITDESEDARAGNVGSGTCGKKATWTLTGKKDNLTLTISGRGRLEDYMGDSAPWMEKGKGIRKIVVEDGITYIGDDSFYSLEKLTDVSLPGSLTAIGDFAFSNCEALQSITIPDGVTKIGRNAFFGCSNLTHITLPDSVKVIGKETFLYCSSLESITLPASLTTIEEYTFTECSSLKSVTIPDSVTCIEQYAFSECSSLTGLKIPDHMTDIGRGAFINCSSLKSVTIPDSMTYIEQDLFSDCSSLKSVTIPDSVTAIYTGAFSDCSSLTDINIPDGVPDLYCVFAGCTSLTDITLPDHLTEIGHNAFEDCTNLKSINIPDSVTTILWCAFRNCSSLTSISIPDSVTFIDDYSFSGCSNLKNITIPDGIKSIGEGAFENCSSLSQITLPENIKSIGEDAFSNCKKLTATVRNRTCLTYCHDNGIPCIYRNPVEFRLNSYNGSNIRVNITKKDDVTGYQIKYADNSSMAGAKSVMLKGSAAPSIVITGLKDGKTYYVKVQSYQKIHDTTYWTNWSAAQSIKITQGPDKTNISKLSTYIGSHIKVDWPKAAGASGYHIKYADNSSMANAKEVFVKGNSSVTKTLTGLKNGKTYYVKIQTYRTVSGKTYWSSWSNAKSIKVDQKPYGSSVNKLTNPSSKAMKISWDKAPSATGYHIQYAADSSMKGTKDIYINNKDTLSKTVTGLTKGKTYYVRIQTYRKVSGKTYWSSWSKAKKIKITK